jgi:rare lipoprotein A
MKILLYTIGIALFSFGWGGPSDSLKRNRVVSVPTSVSDTGLATFYGNLWHGRRTASGIPYHKDSLTCAHLKYPFGSMLLVTNLKNGKTVMVKVTDRGPHVRSRIIDLSMAAAKKIAMVSDGVVKVSVRRIY